MYTSENVCAVCVKSVTFIHIQDMTSTKYWLSKYSYRNGENPRVSIKISWYYLWYICSNRGNGQPRWYPERKWITFVANISPQDDDAEGLIRLSLLRASDGGGDHLYKWEFKWDGFSTFRIGTSVSIMTYIQDMLLINQIFLWYSTTLEVYHQDLDTANRICTEDRTNFYCKQPALNPIMVLQIWIILLD